MGSTGTGRLSDYSGTKAEKGGGPGGRSGEDKCDQPILATLEDVERCSYYGLHHALPKVGLDVVAGLAKRIEVTTAGGEVIGYLPTKFNYLAGCIKSGAHYAGKVTLSLAKPVVQVQVQLSRA